MFTILALDLGDDSEGIIVLVVSLLIILLQKREVFQKTELGKEACYLKSPKICWRVEFDTMKIGWNFAIDAEKNNLVFVIVEFETFGIFAMVPINSNFFVLMPKIIKALHS